MGFLWHESTQDLPRQRVESIAVKFLGEPCYRD